MTRRIEYALLACIVIWAAALRVTGLGPGRSPTFHPALGSVLFIDNLLQTSGISGALHHWTTLFSSVQGLSLIDRSVVAFPPAVMAHLLFGPSFALAAYVGALHGVASVLLAWATARWSAGASAGLVFAALLAVSPVEIVWSRIGGLYIACVPHLLLGILGAQVAARRDSMILAAAAGVVAWLSLYNYYATRLVIPVEIGILWVATLPTRRKAVLSACCLAPLLVGALTASAEGLLQTLWPAAGGGFLPPVERNLGNLVSLAWERWQLHWRATLALVFTAGRTLPPAPWGWGVESGGMLPLPVLLLGAGGLALALADARRHVAWLLLAVLGYAITALSGAEIRRLLPLDVAWNYFAALAVVALGRSRAVAAASRGTLVGLVACGIVAQGVWSSVAIASLTRHATKELASIPFGDGTLGEAKMCPPCDALAFHWRERLRTAGAVVLLDHDERRDRNIFRLGLRGYGMLGALEAGRPAYFATGCGDWRWLPASHRSRQGCLSDPARLRAHLASLDPAPVAVTFHFTIPNASPALVEALRALGTATRPLPGTAHLEITIPGARLPEALEVLERAGPLTRSTTPPPGETSTGQPSLLVERGRLAERMGALPVPNRPVGTDHGHGAHPELPLPPGAVVAIPVDGGGEAV